MAMSAVMLSNDVSDALLSSSSPKPGDLVFQNLLGNLLCEYICSFLLTFSVGFTLRNQLLIWCLKLRFLFLKRRPHLYIYEVKWNRSVVSDSFRLWTVAHQAPPSMGFPSKSTGVGRHSLLQGIFPTQGSNPGLLYCKQTLYPLSH